MEEHKENRLEETAYLERAIKELPPKLRDAIYWAVKNLDALKELCENTDMTLEEIKSAMDSAWAEEHYTTLTCLLIAEYTQQLKENEEI